MDFRLLGPLEIVTNGRQVPLGSVRERFVLVVLLLEAGRQVGSDRLIDALWQTPPPTARAQLHNLISKLRNRLVQAGGDVIRTTSAGYRLDLGEHTLDLARFRELVERARCERDHELSAGLLTSALALWASPVLEDVDEELVAGPRMRLHQEYLAVVQRAAEVTFELGRFETAVQWLDLLLAENPYHEQLYTSRMLALVGAGRRADALTTYRVAYRRLVDDLGVEPGTALSALEQEILAGTVRVPTTLAGPPVGAPAPAAPLRVGRPAEHVPRELPRPAGMLTGREKIIESVGEDLRASGAASPVVLLVGAGGIGKTAIAVAACQAVAAHFPDGLLHADLRGSHSNPVEPHAVLGRFLRSLGVAGSTLPDDPDERLALYRSMQAGRRLLVLLDDAADACQVRSLLPTDPRCAGLITSRRQLGGLIDARRRSVPLMTSADARTLLSRVVGTERIAAEPAATAAIIGLCGLLPLAMCIAAARLATRPDWSLEDFRCRLAAERARLDELALGDLDVRASIGLSYRALDRSSQQLLRRLGDSGLTDWPGWAIAVLGDLHHLRALDQLIDLHLVEPRGRDAVGQQRYGLHDLVAEFAREQAGNDPADERADGVDGLLQGWLGLATGADELLDHGLISAAGLPGAPAQAAPFATACEARTWFEVERVNLLEVVELGARFGIGHLTGRLALRIAGFLAVHGYEDDRVRALLAGLSCGGQDTDLRLRQLNSLINALLQQEVRPELPELADELLGLARGAGDAVWTLRAELLTGAVALRTGRLEEAVARFGEAATSRAAGAAPRLRGKAVEGLAVAHRQAGRPATALPHALDAVGIARQDGSPRILAMRLHTYGDVLLQLGRITEAEAALTESWEISERVDDEQWAANVARALAEIDIRRGDWRSAGRRLANTLSVFESHANRDGTAEALTTLAELAVARGRPGEAVPHLLRALELWRRLGVRLEVARVLARLDRIHCWAEPAPDPAVDHAAECCAELRALGVDESALLLPPSPAPARSA